MPDIGLFELIMIGLALVVIVGPERVPEFFGQIGSAARQLRRWVDDLRAQVRVETEELKAPVVQAEEAVRAEIDRVTEQVTMEADKVAPESSRDGH
ncbi:MAG: hypothetical protein R8J84_00075 [Mariprofundales bacterium]